ncbi:trehalose 6-phosphatase [Hoeflea sp. IMCC20628]|uniref:trehalose-phosphatase n=1 Tax=Hoeflea sp. IMCC20628 TaxID=1620421 RepID=UPI00063BF416|nr:trehalose-phosphatase [Hoeflea sp. IMCC20628]AKI02363.1 trehalose 6-phosphatase [Hoeflea sp. IMCC20628]
MEQRLDYYSLVGFASECSPPEDLNLLTINADETALFLDFDGTLVDIAPTPDSIKVGLGDKLLLDNLSKRHNGAVSIISGRNLKEIDHHLPGFSGVISGGHGAELRHSSGRVEGIACDLERLEHIKKAAMEFASIETRVLVEDKSFGIVLHYRQYPELGNKVCNFLTSLIDGDEEFELQSAKMAVEVKPKGISKAGAIERVMLFEEFAGRDILFAGDDDTDEVAFAWVNEQGGTSVKIGQGPTRAHYRTPSPATFKTWLRTQSATAGA